MPSASAARAISSTRVAPVGVDACGSGPSPGTSSTVTRSSAARARERRLDLARVLAQLGRDEGEAEVRVELRPRSPRRANRCRHEPAVVELEATLSRQTSDLLDVPDRSGRVPPRAGEIALAHHPDVRVERARTADDEAVRPRSRRRDAPGRALQHVGDRTAIGGGDHAGAIVGGDDEGERVDRFDAPAERARDLGSQNDRVAAQVIEKHLGVVRRFGQGHAFATRVESVDARQQAPFGALAEAAHAAHPTGYAGRAQLLDAMRQLRALLGCARERQHERELGCTGRGSARAAA